MPHNKNKISVEWEEFPLDDRPIQGPKCPGYKIHHWRMTIEEGSMGLTSGCQECDENVLGPVGGDAVFMIGTLVGRLEFNPDHPNLGGYHGMNRCDCGWTWNFIPEGIKRD